MLTDHAIPLWRGYQTIVRAVLQAAREPSPTMLATGEGYMDFVLPECFDNTPEGRRREFKVGWQVAIDAALSETPVA